MTRNARLALAAAFVLLSASVPGQEVSKELLLYREIVAEEKALLDALQPASIEALDATRSTADRIDVFTGYLELQLERAALSEELVAIDDVLYSGYGGVDEKMLERTAHRLGFALVFRYTPDAKGAGGNHELFFLQARDTRGHVPTYLGIEYYDERGDRRGLAEFSAFTPNAIVAEGKDVEGLLGVQLATGMFGPDDSGVTFSEVVIRVAFSYHQEVVMFVCQPMRAGDGELRWAPMQIDGRYVEGGDFVHGKSDPESASDLILKFSRTYDD